ncbi:unnamed protein product, partial [Ectocarpus sp. 8 AP-2014]
VPVVGTTAAYRSRTAGKRPVLTRHGQCCGGGRRLPPPDRYRKGGVLFCKGVRSRWHRLSATKVRVGISSRGTGVRCKLHRRGLPLVDFSMTVPSWDTLFHTAISHLVAHLHGVLCVGRGKACGRHSVRQAMLCRNGRVADSACKFLVILLCFTLSLALFIVPFSRSI